MNLDFTQQKVLVTGGTRGIGAALVQKFLESGATVLYTGKNSQSTKQISNAKFLPLDLSDDLSIKVFLKEISKEKVDILVNNAGINKIDNFGDISLEDFRAIQKINLEGPFVLCNHIAPSMAERGFGRIVNVASIFSSITKEKRASYSSSKFALVGMTKAMAVEYATRNVLVNVISPGFIDTELTRSVLSEKQILEMTAQVPIKRLGTPEEIAQVVLFLSSRQNTFITGQNIIADGGFTCV